MDGQGRGLDEGTLLVFASKVYLLQLSLGRGLFGVTFKGRREKGVGGFKKGRDKAR